jgi:hypothetical protein
VRSLTAPLSAVVLVTLSLVASAASAQDAVPPPPPPPPSSAAAPAESQPAAPATTEPSPGEIPEKGAYTHDGFYLRLGIGGGYVDDKFKYTGLGGLFGLDQIEGHASGGSFEADVSAGGAIKPGLIIGGSLFIEQVASPKVTYNGEDINADVSVGTFGLIGPMIDWYPQAHGGFHLGGTIGGARITMKDSSGNLKSNQPVGGGGIFFIGYDWWVAQEWSLGVQAQLTGAALFDSSDDVDHDFASGGITFSVVYN